MSCASTLSEAITPTTHFCFREDGYRITLAKTGAAPTIKTNDDSGLV
jgi:hypothetical protein